MSRKRARFEERVPRIRVQDGALPTDLTRAELRYELTALGRPHKHLTNRQHLIDALIEVQRERETAAQSQRINAIATHNTAHELEISVELKTSQPQVRQRGLAGIATALVLCINEFLTL